MGETASRRWWIIGAFAALLIVALGLFGCGANSEENSKPANDANNTSAQDEEANHSEINTIENGKLTVAASLDFPPFENMGEGKTEAEGFSVDLMKAIGEKLGLEVEYLPTQAFDTIIPTIQSGGKADVGVSSFTVTDERKEQIDFTDSYMTSNQGIAVMKSSGITKDDYTTALDGKKVAVQSGTTGEAWAQENLPGAEVVPYQEMTAVFTALQSDQAQAVVADLPVVQYYVNDAYKDAEVIAEIPTGEVYAMVVSKDNPNLVTELNKGLAEVKADGTYAELYKKWFGTEPSEATMNATEVSADDTEPGNATEAGSGATTSDEGSSISGDGGHSTEDATTTAEDAEK